MSENFASGNPVGSSEGLTYEADLCGNIEQALKGLLGYGIMGLELVQNADDAGADTLVFDATTEALLVHNNAEFTSCGHLHGRCQWEKAGDPQGLKRPCNFHAISRMGSRSKIAASEQIGRFGIGFVSVYQVTDTPIIRSVGAQVQLDPLSGRGAVSQIEHKAGTEFVLPWASASSDIRSALNRSPTPANVASSVASEIAQMLRSSLLFLRHLQRVEVREDGRLVTAVNIDRGAEKLTLDFGPSGKNEWLILEGSADAVIEAEQLSQRFEALERLDRSRTVSLAIPIDEGPIEGLLFAYLPTRHATGLPLHINADFFPHASRQDIVLKGEDHERYWNEALIITAASILSENFEKIRDTLGPKKLWELGSAAYKMRGETAFGAFWEGFAEGAALHPCVWTQATNWHLGEGTFLAPENMPPAERSALEMVGVDIIDESLRPEFTALTAVGSRNLVLSTAVSALEENAGASIGKEEPFVPDLWDAVARLMQVSEGRTGYAAVVQRLQAAVFLLDIDGDAKSPNQVWRLPSGVSSRHIRRYFPDCPIVSDKVAANPSLEGLIDELTLEEFAALLSNALREESDTLNLVGTTPEDATTFYKLLVSFPADELGRTEQRLAETPLLRTKQGFVRPARSQLPGHFRDPSGYFRLIDTSLFPPGMDEFARYVLNVDVLSFHEYIDNHLVTILATDLTREQYREIVTQIVTHKNELADKGSLARLADRPFVRTKAGTYAKPSDCYYWSAPLESILGDDRETWVDQSWMPSGSNGAKLQDLLETQLGMPVTVTARHIVDRIWELADDGTPDEVADKVTPLIRHMIERWPRFGEAERETFQELQDLEFLPALVDGERDPENLYLPTEVYRAARAAGFSSQVAVIDLAPLRRASSTVNEILDLLEVPEEPATQVVVDHLHSCVRENVAPSTVTYAILNERVDAENDLAAIEALTAHNFIYDPKLERYLGPDEVFWLPPPFRGYWWQANRNMAQHSALYTLLGVRDEPEATDYASLMLKIAAKADLTAEDLEIHSRCLDKLCGFLEENDPGFFGAISLLKTDGSLLTVDGDAVWPEDAIWIDTPQLADAFGPALNDCLVKPPEAARTSLVRLYQAMGARQLSKVASLRLAGEPDRKPEPQASAHLQERADLLLWIAPNTGSRRALQSMLKAIEVQSSESLGVRAEIAEFDPPVCSPITQVSAYFEAERQTLHVVPLRSGINWPSAMTVLFAELEGLSAVSDPKAIVAAATLIMVSSSRETAQDALVDSGYVMPMDVAEEELGSALGELDEQPEEEELPAADLNATDENPELVEGAADPSDDHADGAERDEVESEELSPERVPLAGGEEGPNGLTDLTEEGDAEENYQSKRSSAPLGRNNDAVERSPSDNSATAQASKSKIKPNMGGRERKARTSRMLSYVSREGDRGSDDTDQSTNGEDISALIDVAAVSAALKFEQQRGWEPEEQPHNNPGYDIRSVGPNGERRLIEVKGLENEWTQRGVKLSHVQFDMAQRHPTEYWIYIVEHARDLKSQHVNAISNPFEKVEEYWFDNAWRAHAEEMASAFKMNLQVGAIVRHKLWGKGTIIEVNRSDFAIKVKVDFGFEGTKFIPLNSSLELLG
ncbi:DUF3883 domain-containing protein [Alteriqipengyuania sp. WL0013]|uniref:DUF3883 domain-containing protein n=1 Tax=Alteriqipengyuania sp. WL0013 TaxID=3110773 RepID=UPI002C90C6EB|nr:DUF3883 domain-containing protein [Alteriqipengyuania sp. WL0013]MEB3415012.1 DUF3883 domain-containing protein [Alteriqipengyuania sp. WL0013]